MSGEKGGGTIDIDHTTILLYMHLGQYHFCFVVDLVRRQLSRMNNASRNIDFV